ncbi:Probable tRNA N6-adenosine threonylcarbamoyltransferase, partial [Durusdinium trenchii]
ACAVATPPPPPPAQSDAARAGERGNGRDLVVLGVETSCDDTCVAILKSRRRNRDDWDLVGENENDKVEVLANQLASQFGIHAEYGGIVPRLAVRAHQDNLPQVLEKAFEEASMTWQNIDAIAVTRGPGLSPCLWAGLSTCCDAAQQYEIPLIDINHLEAHALMPRLTQGPQTLRFPFLTLICSGGHTMLMLVRGVRQYEVLGTTLDDAVGETFDKVARALRVEGHEGHLGAGLERLAAEGCAERGPAFRVPMENYGDTCNFSFSGLKSAATRAVKALEKRAQGGTLDSASADIAAAFQATAVKHLTRGTRRALAFLGHRVSRSAPRNIVRNFDRDVERRPATLRHELPSALVLSGGVASNEFLRAEMRKLASYFEDDLRLHHPPAALCTDNGVMVAYAALEILSDKRWLDDFARRDPTELQADPQWRFLD